MIRSCFAVFVGLVVMMVSVFVVDWVVGMMMLPPEPKGTAAEAPIAFQIANVSYSALGALFGGYVAAWIGRRAPVAHGLALAGVVLVLGVASLILSQTMPPPTEGWREAAWYPPVLAVLGPVGALAGGWLRWVQTRARPAAEPTSTTAATGE
jgi:hypothetical protein